MTTDATAEATTRLRAAGCVFAEEEAALLVAEAPPGLLEAWLTRRVAGEPLEHVLGWASFDGLRVPVAPGVFVPRQRSVLLVREAARAAARHRGGASIVVDLCAGAGAVGLAVAIRVPGTQVHAVDIDPAAVACATRALADVGGVAYLGDLAAPLPPDLRGHVDVLVANAPYVPSDEVAMMPREARDHEPAVALDGGPDGLDVQRRVIALAPDWLAPHGRVLVETSRRQGPASARAMSAAGLRVRVLHDDALEATVVVGRPRTPATEPPRPRPAPTRER